MLELVRTHIETKRNTVANWESNNDVWLRPNQCKGYNFSFVNTWSWAWTENDDIPQSIFACITWKWEQSSLNWEFLLSLCFDGQEQKEQIPCLQRRKCDYLDWCSAEYSTASGTIIRGRKWLAKATSISFLLTSSKCCSRTLSCSSFVCVSNFGVFSFWTYLLRLLASPTVWDLQVKDKR